MVSFLPYSILVSRVALIDMCAVSLGLIYMFYLYRLMTENDRKRSIVTMAITILVGNSKLFGQSLRACSPLLF